MPGWRSIRGRVAVVITVPICLLLAVAGLMVNGRAEALSDARTTRTEVGLSLRIQALVHQLQRERGLTNGLLGGEADFRPPLAATRKRVDTALRAMRRERTVEDVVHRHLQHLGDVRAATDTDTADRAATLAFYTTAVDALNAVDPVAGTAAGADRRLRCGNWPWRRSRSLSNAGSSTACSPKAAFTAVSTSPSPRYVPRVSPPSPGSGRSPPHPSARP